ncbi:MAG: hypothetical protein OEN56_09100 [Gemmatimonadota bacterium]|nr:hypothetical protein [Gemmatimonadota bacterium]MDH3424974.1 hypothetical protein [Gemmatimonadota bacterium]
MSERTRRFTDREVALVLKRATELDESDGAGAAGGLSLEDLNEIAREVGIAPAAIERAVASLDRGARIAPSLAGAPTVRKAAQAVPGELDQEGVARLMTVVDERTDTTGAITEALGSVRWTGQDRFKSTRVSVTPRNGETTIEVVEKAEPKMRRIFQLLPTAWGPMIAAPFIGALQLPVAGSLALIAASMIAGFAVGRGVWSLVSSASGRRVHRLAAELADEAVSASGTTPS